MFTKNIDSDAQFGQLTASASRNSSKGIKQTISVGKYIWLRICFGAMKLLAVLFLALICQNVESAMLNYPRVLLPIFDKISINFTLEVIEKGCFKW